MPPMDLLIPMVTAALTLANTVLLFMGNRRSAKIHREMNGMKLQLLAEAEQRGRRLATHDPNDGPAGGRDRVRSRRVPGRDRSA